MGSGLAGKTMCALSAMRDSSDRRSRASPAENWSVSALSSYRRLYTRKGSTLRSALYTCPRHTKYCASNDDVLCVQACQWCEPVSTCAAANMQKSLLRIPHRTTAMHVIASGMVQGNYLQLSDEGDVWVVHDDEGWAHIPEQAFLVGVERCKADAPQRGPPILLYLRTCAMHDTVCNSVVLLVSQRLQTHFGPPAVNPGEGRT